MEVKDYPFKNTGHIRIVPASWIFTYKHCSYIVKASFLFYNYAHKLFIFLHNSQLTAFIMQPAKMAHFYKDIEQKRTIVHNCFTNGFIE